MALPSFESEWKDGVRLRPRVYVLEIRDRDKHDRGPIAWLFVERVETCRKDERDGSVYEASIRLSYERIAPKLARDASGKGHFSGSYSRAFGDGPAVSLTSATTTRGTVFLDLPHLDGQRIGTYLMNEIVTWVRQWPDARVRAVELLPGQAGDDNKARRNRFYEQFGLVFDYRDREQREGLSRPMLAAALTPVETWKQNIRERDARQYLGEVLSERDRLGSDLAQRERAVRSLVDEIRRAEAHPVRWALRQVWWRWAPIAGQVVMLLIVVALVWAALRSG
jgi:GNAT superfamily N-acetyltransferase